MILQHDNPEIEQDLATAKNRISELDVKKTSLSRGKMVRWWKRAWTVKIS